MADHVFSPSIFPAGWHASVPDARSVETAKGRVDFLRQLHDREALLPGQQRRFLDSEGWIAWSGPAIAGCSSSSSLRTG